MKVRSALGASLAALSLSLVAASPAAAGGGEWDTLATSGFTYHSSTGTYLSDVVSSGGGNFRICTHYTNNTAYYNLSEYDPDNADERQIWFQKIEPGACGGTINVDYYVDGTDGKAELYVERADSSALNDYVTLQD